MTVLPGSKDKSMDLAVDDVYQSWENSPLVVEVKENVPAGAYDLKLVPGRKRGPGAGDRNGR